MLNESMPVSDELGDASKASFKDISNGVERAEARAKEPSEFLSLNANYYIDPENKAADLAFDASCILEGLAATVQCLVDGLSDEKSPMSASTSTQVVAMLYNVGYQLEMLQGIAGALSSAKFPSEASA